MIKKKDLAKALGVGAANITRWARRGMPLYSAEAAIAWRAQNIRPRMAPAPAQPTPAPPSNSPSPAPISVGRLLAIIRELGDTTDPAELEELRGALAFLPPAIRPRISLSAETYRRLLGPEILEAIAAAPGDPLTDAEFDDWSWFLMLAPFTRHA